MAAVAARNVLGALALMFGLTGATFAAEGEFSFSCFTSTANAVNCATGSSQLHLNVTGTTGVSFVFTNDGPLASSITDIYFDWAGPVPSGITQDPNAIVNGSGVSFSWGANPKTLPGGENLDPDFRVNLAADSNPGSSGASGTMANGVNPGEMLSFNWSSGYSAQQAIADLASGVLRVGIHVQGFADGGSVSMVSIAPPVPEPGALALLLAGGAMVGAAVKRRRRV